MLVWMLALSAFGQESTDDLVRLNAQVFRPSVDASHTLWSDDSAVRDDGVVTGKAMVQYANGPYVEPGSEGMKTRYVSDIAELDLAGGYSFGRLRVGGHLPLYLYTASQVAPNAPGLGDVALDVKGSLVDRSEGPVGLALAARLALPTATVAAPLGADATSWELAAILDKPIGDFLVVANVGTRGVPEQVSGDLVWTDQFFFRGGAGYAIDAAGGLSAELAGHANYKLLGNSAGVPLEAMVGGYRRLVDSWVIRGGVSAGLTSAVGAARVRGLLGLSWEPKSLPDRDLDGIADKRDGCPDVPEDLDGYNDADGCADPSVTIEIALVGDEGASVQLAQTTITGPDGVHTVRGTMVVAEVHPGDVQIEIDAAGFEPATRELFVPLGGQHRYIEQLTPKQGALRLWAVDPDGRPILDAHASVSGKSPVPLRVDAIPATVGDHAVTVMADGYVASATNVRVDAGQTVERAVVLALADAKPETAPSGIAQLAGDRIRIQERVNFDLNLASIRPESQRVLDAVAAILVAQPGLKRVRVAGHTDARGPERFNLELSSDRAASVRDYLVGQGVAADRLEAVGYGSSQPRTADPEDDANRRVEFIVVDGPRS